jgi:hypothetical protein
LFPLLAKKKKDIKYPYLAVGFNDAALATLIVLLILLRVFGDPKNNDQNK